MDKLMFLVQGSSPDPYGVSIQIKEGLAVGIFCTCPSGDFGQYCKHMGMVIEGDASSVLNPEKLPSVAAYMGDSPIQKALTFYKEKLSEIEKQEKALKKLKQIAKKELNKTLAGLAD